MPNEKAKVSHISKVFGAEMAACRRYKNIKQETISAELGISQATLSRYENGGIEYSIDQAYKHWERLKYAKGYETDFPKVIAKCVKEAEERKRINARVEGKKIINDRLA